MNKNKTKPIVCIRQISKSFAGVVTAVSDVSLDIYEGEFFALLGPSGCGKTTLLRMLAGLEVPTSGDILIDGHSMHDVAPNQRPVNMVFQSYAVFPHMNVFNNVAYGLRVSGIAHDEAQQRVQEALALVQLDGFEQRMPEQLSGGQRQRVALARALVKRPRVLLLDEPLSALDAKLREAMQLELVKLQHAVGITFIIVTHDQHEALSMANRIAVMQSGQVRQVATPNVLYEYPQNRFVADFIGKTNLFEGTLCKPAGDKIQIEIKTLGTIVLAHAKNMQRAQMQGNDDASRAGGNSDNTSRADSDCASGAQAHDNLYEGTIGVVVRPEKVQLFHQKPSDEFIAFAATVDNIVYQGSNSHVHLTTRQGASVSATVQNTHRDTTPPQCGAQVWCAWQVEDTLLLRN